MCLALKEAHNLTAVYFLPTQKNPLKKIACLDAQHRKNMLELALKKVPDCYCHPLELERKGPSYTIDTVKKLRSIEPFCSSKMYLLMGEDLLDDFHKWKNVHELISFIQPLVASRSEDVLPGLWQKDPLLVKAINKGFTKTPLLDISSTEIRKRLKRGMYCGHLLNQDVLEYISNHKLYM